MKDVGVDSASSTTAGVRLTVLSPANQHRPSRDEKADHALDGEQYPVRVRTHMRCLCKECQAIVRKVLTAMRKPSMSPTYMEVVDERWPDGD